MQNYQKNRRIMVKFVIIIVVLNNKQREIKIERKQEHGVLCVLEALFSAQPLDFRVQI